MELLKENLLEYLGKSREEIKIYISSSFKNLDYYYNKALEKNKNAYLFNTYSNDLKDKLDINTKLIETLSKDNNEKYIFIDFNLAMNVFFDEAKYFYLKKGEKYSLKEIEQKLESFFYEREYILSELGQYSRRGEIIDIFGYGQDNPIRLDFFDIELEKIKVFDIENQKSFKELNEIKIYSGKLEGKTILITDLANKFSEKKVKFYIENKEMIEYNLETMMILDITNKDKLQKRYEQILEKAEKLQVNISKERNYKSEIQEQKSKNIKKHRKYQNITDLVKGDYVIHIQHGVGIYDGLELISNKECLSIRYADRDKLYIPIEQIGRLEKYINISGQEPFLYKLGTRGFGRRQKKYVEDIRQTAKMLLEIQAKREKTNGIVFLEDTIWFKEFEEQFEHAETKDQLIAIEEIKKDMQSPKIMDRIVCGDVGYGKTEVAMRAAFKAVESGYQVAVLVPTTILAQQHYDRFLKRYKNFPINISVYSRLSANKNILKDLSNGNIDILIGTHKLLSEEVVFNNLGLLIIDEEQKFGVRHKEKLKSKKQDLDVLTLTATPIPRTLNLALLGIRDISLITTPPLQKIPIKTKVIENVEDKELRNIILKEISREGQVFYVSNNVKDMSQKKKELQKILPDFIKIEYINGQLNPSEIREKIKAFENEEFHILLTSTIIENGIDITNVNTIIIEDFVKLGLSQIYQLRGRVGRGNRQAYCYLLKNKKSTKKGEEKEQTMRNIENITSGGYRISMEDMNIRGAGEILGEKQHGAIETFGYDLYLRMLNEEIKHQSNAKKEKLENVEINLIDKGYIPESYIEERERIKIYRRLYSYEEIKEVIELEKELIDRFGLIPKDLENLFIYIKVKIYAKLNFIERIDEKNGKIFLKYYKKVSNLDQSVVILSKEEFLKKVWSE
ncbi:DEAD/DEAH box helicase [Oceanivirga salmonicida]|uniref:DEAD/DEAH box helicase n=1 Tax=Oceanivirga salmonicida TaxID=1769291 RepID=UPI0012E3116D|nr:DEAD/DEAH box helicase [Oceanivirga salmonicida]